MSWHPFSFAQGQRGAPGTLAMSKDGILCYVTGVQSHVRATFSQPWSWLVGTLRVGGDRLYGDGELKAQGSFPTLCQTAMVSTPA